MCVCADVQNEGKTVQAVRIRGPRVRFNAKRAHCTEATQALMTFVPLPRKKAITPDIVARQPYARTMPFSFTYRIDPGPAVQPSKT